MAIPDNPRGSAVKAISGAIDALRTGEGLKGQLLRGGVGSIAVKIGSTLINVLLAIVLARTLGVEGFGVYSFVFALITIMAIPAQMGLPNLVVRETAKAQANGDWALMKGLWRWSTLMALAMSVALMAVGAAAAWIFAAQLPEGGLAVFYWGLVLVPLIALGNLRGAALRGLRHVVQGQLPEFILRPAFLIVLVLGMHFGLSARTVTASDAMLLHAIASLAAFAIGAWMLLRARPGELREAAASETRPGAWLKSALPLGMIEGMKLLNQHLGVVTLGLLAATEEAGIFRIAIQVGSLTGIGLIIANSFASPFIARLHARNEHRKLKVLLLILFSATQCAALIILIIYVIYGDKIVSVAFGNNYATAYFPILLISAGQMANGLGGLLAIYLTMTDRQTAALNCAIVAGSLHVILAIVLVPHFGLTGAANAFLITQIGWSAILAGYLVFFTNDVEYNR